MDVMTGPGTGFRPKLALARRAAAGIALCLAGLALAPSAAHAQPPDVETINSARTGGSVPEPRDLRDVSAWLAWKDAQQISALPAEARLFYRRGLLAMQAGQTQEAFANVRGAVELDPAYLQPHVTLASWTLFRDPAELLQHCAAVVEVWRHDFTVQADVLANLLVLGLEALFAGLMFAGFFIVLHRRHELSHSLKESLARTISPQTARWWVPVILALPFLAGLGLTLPVLFLLGVSWPVLRLRERVLSVLLALAAFTAPLALGTLDRFTLALRTDAGPFHEMPLLENAGYDAERAERLEREAREDARNPYAQFALGWHARRGGQLEVAERAYRAAITLAPDDAAALTNLGNVLAMRGHSDEALQLYARAVKADPEEAAPHFNASQLHLRRFEYTPANDELRQASALDFDLVKRYQSRAGTAGLLPLVDVWPAPARFWHTLRTARLPRGHMPLPLSLRGHLETSGWGFSVVVALVSWLGLWAGRWQHRRLPLRVCGNCGVVVCRRCAKRRREVALCPECDRIGAGAETQEFSRVLLLQYRSRRRQRTRFVRTAAATLLPGYGLLAHQRVFGPTLLIAFTWLMIRLTFDFHPPYSLTPRLTMPGSEVPAVVLFAGLALLYAWSLGSYFWVVSRERARESKLEAAGRGRITQSTHRQNTLAA